MIQKELIKNYTQLVKEEGLEVNICSYFLIFCVLKTNNFTAFRGDHREILELCDAR